jgi:hypothetical protein
MKRGLDYDKMVAKAKAAKGKEPLEKNPDNLHEEKKSENGETTPTH